MNRRVNWALWSGLLLSVAAFISYFTLFARFPITRDFPWASLLLFAAAIMMMLAGLRNAFRADGALRKTVASLVGVVTIGIVAFFLFMIFVIARRLPSPATAVALGRQAPEFTLVDANRKAVSLSSLLARPGTNGVLLIFYRGYW